jgi:hypothetical protein
MIPDPSPPFDVSMVGSAPQQLAYLLTRSPTLGLRAEVDQLLARIMEQLRLQPRAWGDPIRNFPSLKTVQYRGQAGFLLAYYSVHDRLPWVFLSSVTTPKGHPLSRGDT